MVILKDLLKVLFDVTKIQLLAYDNYKLQHTFIFGTDIDETIHQYRDRQLGKLSIIDEKINVHGDVKKSGVAEIGFNVKLDAIPDEILNAEVTHILLGSRCSCDGRELTAYINMSALAVEMATAKLADKVRPLDQDEE